MSSNVSSKGVNTMGTINTEIDVEAELAQFARRGAQRASVWITKIEHWTDSMIDPNFTAKQRRTRRSSSAG